MANPSIRQLEKHIRVAAKNSSNIAFSKHARVRMKQRQISDAMVIEALLRGSIKLQPEPDTKDPDSLVCRMEWFVAGIGVGVSVSVCYPADGMIVITVFEVRKV